MQKGGPPPLQAACRSRRPLPAEGIRHCGESDGRSIVCSGKHATHSLLQQIFSFVDGGLVQAAREMPCADDWAVDSGAVIDAINRCRGIKTKIRRQKLAADLPDSGKYLLLSGSRDHFDFLNCDSRQLVLTKSGQHLNLESDDAAAYLFKHCLVRDSGRSGYRLNMLACR